MRLLGSSIKAPSSLDVVVITGAAAVNGYASQLATLSAAVEDAPVTARWAWTSMSVLDPAAGRTPWMVGVTNGERLLAAVVLLDDDTGSVRRTILAGTEDGHRGALLATSAPIAVRLGQALAHELVSELREFSLGPLRHGAALGALLEHLPVGLIIDEENIPVVRSHPTLGPALSHGTQRTLRKAHNRMMADDIRSEIQITADRQVITGLLPLLENISRDRDQSGGRLSPLDDPDTRRLWERRLLALAGAGSLRLVTHLLNGELAAYLLGIDDGTAFRVLEGRFVGDWARYAPGRVLEAAVLEGVLQSPQYEMLDWMTTVAPESLLGSNDVDPHVVIRGRS